MTDKVMIDGVDVSGCAWCDYEPNSEPYCRINDGEDLDCIDNSNCYYKQLQRKAQECENIFKKTYEMWMYYIANGINNASDLNTQYLLEDLGKVVKMLAELCDWQDATLNYYTGNIQNETNRYKQALEKIEEYVTTTLRMPLERKFILGIINEVKDA